MAVNRDEILRELKVEEIQHPEAESLSNRDILINLGKLAYTQSNIFLDGSNNPINPFDIPDIGTVAFLISLISGMSKTKINKLGSDVDVNGDLDLSAEIIPAYSTYTVYINGYSGLQAISYNESTKILSGFSVSPSDDIKIIFI